MSELLSIRGAASGVEVCSLDNDLFHSTVNNIRFPRGAKCKLWTKRISGQEAQIDIEFTNDITVDNPSWKKVDSQYLASAGELDLEKRKPLILHDIDNKCAVRFNRVSGTGDSFIDAEIEIEES